MSLLLIAMLVLVPLPFTSVQELTASAAFQGGLVCPDGENTVTKLATEKEGIQYGVLVASNGAVLIIDGREGDEYPVWAVQMTDSGGLTVVRSFTWGEFLNEFSQTHPCEMFKKVMGGTA